MQRLQKVAIVTPYHNEPEKYVKKCMESVREQTYPCTHILISDGSETCFVSEHESVIHVKLPYESNDWGNTPRGIGSILADTYGFDAITYLDADNWYEADHIEKMVSQSINSGASIITCKRQFFTLEERNMNIVEFLEDRNGHVDTSCFFLTRPAFELTKNWFMPKIVAALCDRYFLAKVIQSQLGIMFNRVLHTQLC